MEIVRDLSRTYPSHVYYQQRQGPGQRSLFNVLKAYSVYDSQVSFASLGHALSCIMCRVDLHAALYGWLQLAYLDPSPVAISGPMSTDGK